MDEPANDRWRGESQEQAEAAGSLLLSAYRLQATLVILAVLAAIYYASSLLIPVVFGMLLALLFKPLVRWLAERHIRAGVSASLITLAIIVLLLAGVAAGGGQATTYVEDVPALIEAVRDRFAVVFETVERASMAPEEEEAAAEQPQAASPGVVTESGELQKPPEPMEPERPPLRIFGVQPGDLVMQIFSQTGALLLGLVIALGLMFFVLASGDLFLLKLVQMLPHLSEKKEAVVAAHELESDVSAYLVTLTLINTGLAIVTFIPLWFIGMPRAPLWAALAGLLNYVPYVGPIFYMVLLIPAALIAFESFEYALLAPLAFLVINTIEAYVVTPTIMGKRFRINPVIVFLWLIIWGWAWGVAGALLATPMLVCFRIVCEHIHTLEPVGHFLSDSPQRTDAARHEGEEEPQDQEAPEPTPQVRPSGGG